MARLLTLQPNKTYATRENAVKAVEKLVPADRLTEQTYFIYTHTDGRFFPVFVGERALTAQLHFNFHVVA